ncbi:DUF5906 domain-containing protein [Sorangium sp. So ce693]|uniref:DUF5906 domain-containing protein n=1 Tax=Sorangium sp. So ce693 TaxID=3133318 RepID=UPI003F60688C
MLFGEGGNGKSAGINLVRAMFPPEALASLPPQRWTERFALSAPEGKLANFVSETPSGERLEGGAFKAVVTGDPVTAERKHRDPFEFRPVAGHAGDRGLELVHEDDLVEREIGPRLASP